MGIVGLELDQTLNPSAVESVELYREKNTDGGQSLERNTHF